MESHAEDITIHPVVKSFFKNVHMFDSYTFFDITKHEMQALSIIIGKFLDSLIPLLKWLEQGIQIQINTSDEFTKFLDFTLGRSFASFDHCFYFSDHRLSLVNRLLCNGCAHLNGLTNHLDG